jgi:hypothetical protein
VVSETLQFVWRDAWKNFLYQFDSKCARAVDKKNFPCVENQMTFDQHNLFLYSLLQLIPVAPIPVAERSKARAYCRSLAGIASLNPAGGMDVCIVL